MIKIFSTIIFDMDGVLIDSEPLFREVESQMLFELGINISDEELNTYVGRPSHEFWAEILERFDIDTLTVEEAVDINGKRYIEILSKKQDLKLIDGVEDWIKNLIKENKNIIIASSSSKSIIELILDKFSIRKYFVNVVAGDSVKKGKPNPEIFLKAASVFNVTPDECMVIEDSTNGIKAAKAAGMYCVAYKNKNSGIQNYEIADCYIDEFTEEEYHKVFRGVR